MRKFTERFKLTALSLQELRAGVKAAVERLAARDVKCDGHIVAQANIINVAILYYLKHAPEEQDQIAVDLIPELERHKASLTPLAIEPLVKSARRKRTAYAGQATVVHSDAGGNNHVADNHLSKSRRS